MGWESNQSLTGLLTPSGHCRAQLYRRGALLPLRYDHARSMRNALAGNLSPSLTACNTKPRWPCTRWLIGALLLLAFSPRVFSWNWSVGGHSVTDHRSPYRVSPPWLLCHLIHVSPCEWSTWLSAADVIDYRWPTGSIMNHNLCRNTRTKQKSYSTWPIIQDPKWIINFIHLFKWLRRQLCFNETLAYTRLLPWTVVFGYGWMVIHQFMY